MSRLGVLPLILFLLPAFTVSEGEEVDREYLVKIDLPSRDYLYRLEDLHISILENMGDYVFAAASSQGLRLVGAEGLVCTILDENPREKSYYLVFLIHETELEPLRALGEVLYFDGRAALLRTREEEPEGLFAGRWELKRLRKRPISVKRPREWHQPRSVATDPLVEQMVAAVSQDSVTEYIQRLQDFLTRYSPTDSAVAASNWIQGKFLSLGIDSVFQHRYQTGYPDNVIATIPGLMRPELVYIICGHFDCTSEDPWNDAPGADDNASGTATTIEAARVMNSYSFDATVKFIAFGGEEQGLVGSGYYASMCRAQGDSIIGVLNFDMVGYGGTSLEMSSIGNNPSEWLVDFMMACGDTYVPGLAMQKVIDSGMRWSDHAPFWDEGYDALCAIETEMTPYYHTTMDRIETLNLPFATECTKVGVATLASLALPITPTEPHITIYHLAIDDSAGNGNGRVDPGETVDLVTTLRNLGLDATNVQAVLRESDLYLSVEDSSSFFGDIVQGDTASNSSDPYVLTVSPSTPVGHAATCTLHIAADGGYEVDRPIGLVIGDPTTGPGGPDNYGYYCYDDRDVGYTECPTYSWLEIAPPGPGSIISEISSHDDNWTTRTLPFTFKYYGTDETLISICSNGWMSFGAANTASWRNSPIPDSSGPAAMVAPFWDDLHTGSTHHGDVYEYYDVTNHRYILEWTEVAHWGEPTVWETFQVILYDPLYDTTVTGDGEIICQYERVEAPNSCTVGIENHSETDGFEYLYNGIYDRYASPLEVGRAVKFTTDPPVPVGIYERREAGSQRQEIRLLQNHPNPFRRATTFTYSLPRRHGDAETRRGGEVSTYQRINLSIYDVAGRLVRTLVDGEQEPGSHVVTWDGRNSSGREVAGGVYFYRLGRPGFSLTRKMVLIR